MRALRISAACLVGAVLLGVAGARGGTAAAPAPLRHLVLAELFTSEGCSSCPPADALLRQLADQSPVAGVEVLGLEEHVDYWDSLGWRDPFSSAAFTRRQSEYDARVFHGGDIYTPQLVVDGAFETVGSDARGVRDAIARAACRPAADVRLTSTPADSRVHIEVRVDAPPAVDHRKDADILVAVVEDDLTSHVDRGENRGRTLPHAAVVRSMKVIGALKSSASSGDAIADVPVDRGWQMPHVRVVAFVQERGTMRILGSAAQPFTAAPSR